MMMHFLQFGCPPLELFLKSCDSVSGKNWSNSLVLGNYGYKSDYLYNVSLVNGDYKGIYWGGVNQTWLASPGEWYGEYAQWYVWPNDEKIEDRSYVDVNSLSVKPIVGIQTSIFNNKYELINE